MAAAATLCAAVLSGTPPASAGTPQPPAPVPTSLATTTSIYDYQYRFVLGASGTGGDFSSPSSGPASVSYSGSMSAHWALQFDTDFTVDEKARTVDAEGYGPSGAYGTGTLVSLSPTGPPSSTDELSLTATSQTGTSSCAVPAGTKFVAQGTLHDLWGGGPSSDAFETGQVPLLLSGSSASPSPGSFKCSNPPSTFEIGAFTVPGFAGDGIGTAAGCARGEAELDKVPQPVLRVPVADLGRDFATLVFEEGFSCVPTLLGATYTAHVRYVMLLSLSTINGLNARELRVKYVKELLETGGHVDQALALLRERHVSAGTEKEVKDDLDEALRTLVQMDDVVLPPGAVTEILRAIGWLRDALAYPTLPAVESSCRQAETAAEKAALYTEQVM